MRGHAHVSYIALGEKQLREEAKHLENVDKLKWVLDSEHLKSRGTVNWSSVVLLVWRNQVMLWTGYLLWPEDSFISIQVDSN